MSPSEKITLTAALWAAFAAGNLLYQIIWEHCYPCAVERSWFQLWAMVHLCAAMIYLDRRST
jgi:hypothetical protein